MKPLRHLVLFFISVCLLTACDADDDTGPDSCSNGECHYEMFTNASLNVLGVGKFVSIDDGDNIVFRYLYTFNDNPAIADDEYSDIVVIEVAPDVNEFQLEGGEELEKAKVLFTRLCFCFETGYFSPASGKITGRKITEGTWYIEFDLEFNTPNSSYPVSSAGIYTR